MKDLLFTFALILIVAPFGLLASAWQLRSMKKRLNHWSQDVRFKLQGIRYRPFNKGPRFGTHFFQGAVFDIWGFDDRGQWRSGRVAVGHSGLFRKKYWIEADWPVYYA